MRKAKRVFLIVLDSLGIGDAPDADKFDDVGSNTLKSIANHPSYRTPNMQNIGLFNIDGVDTLQAPVAKPSGAFARIEEASMGKDTTIGHWEIAGIISPQALPTFPEGFSAEVLDAFTEATRRGWLCNKPYSGTEVIREFGDEHMATGKYIVYTSADSVFQIAAHEDVVPLEELYEACRKARKILTGANGVGRVIARPFVGTSGNYTRTNNRHDFSLEPPATTMLDVIVDNGMVVKGIGKINDIFVGKGISTTYSVVGNKEDEAEALRIMRTEDFNGLCFVNLVDFDMLYGHRRDIAGYAAAANEFDNQLAQMLKELKADDVLMITADHGCDPGYKGTDHTRECIPWLIYGDMIKAGTNLGTLKTFADISATILELLGLPLETSGSSHVVELEG